MSTRDPRIDRYIAGAAPFARPILVHLRGLVHAACPGVEETLKWGMPSFTYHGILCGMAAFKQHATFGFWKHSLVVEKGRHPAATAMGSFGRLTSISDLPSKRILTTYIRKAMRLNEEGVSARPKTARTSKPAPRVPTDLRNALATSQKARAAWTTFSPSHRREYIEWITDAKRPDTRERRVATTLEWLILGRHRNWQYESRAPRR